MQGPNETTIQVPHGITKPTVFVGDIHGHRDALKVTLKSLGLTDSRDKWRQGTDLVLAGDMLADRIPDDFKVAHFILKLRRQMQEAGDELVTLMGNHDLEAIQFLLGGIGGPLEYIHKPWFIEGIRPLGKALMGPHVKDQGGAKGIMELLIARQMQPQGIPYHLRSQKRGRELLTVLEELRPWHQAGAVLFQHTPPSWRTLEELADPALINHPDNIRELIGGTMSNSDAIQWFETIKGITHAHNRLGLIPVDDNYLWEIPLDKGIRTFAFGHDVDSARVLTRTHPQGALTLIGADYGFGKRRDHIGSQGMPLSAVRFNPGNTVTIGFTLGNL